MAARLPVLELKKGMLIGFNPGTGTIIREITSIEIGVEAVRINLKSAGQFIDRFNRIELKKGMRIGIDPGNGGVMIRDIVQAELGSELIKLTLKEVSGTSERRWAKTKRPEHVSPE